MFLLFLLALFNRTDPFAPSCLFDEPLKNLGIDAGLQAFIDLLVLYHPTAI